VACPTENHPGAFVVNLEGQRQTYGSVNAVKVVFRILFGHNLGGTAIKIVPEHFLLRFFCIKTSASRRPRLNRGVGE
jgi:hypothetical protein